MRFSIVLMFIFSFVCTSCGKNSPSSSQVMRINLPADPATLDPRKARDLNAVTLCRMLFEGLTRISKEGQPEFAIADAVEISDDGLEYVFQLRETFWSNGDRVTSYDFAQSWKSILDPEFPTDIAYQLYVIQNAKNVKLGEMTFESLGVKTPNPSTLIVQLEQPTPYFLEVCSMASFMPVPQRVAFKNPDWVFDAKSFVGNGPFVLKQWKHNDEILIGKNEKYWDASNVHLQEVSLVMVSNESEIQMFEEGKLDWAGSPLSTLPIDAIKHLKETNQLKISPFSGTQLLRVNTSEKVQGNILSLSQFRKALAYAIDRKSITEHLLQGGQTPARSLVPPEMGLCKEGYFSDQNPELSLNLLHASLEKMGIEKESLAPIILSFVGSDRNSSLAQAIQKQWQTVLGIEVVLEAVEPKVFYQKIKERDFQISIGSWVADFNDPVNFLEVFKYKEGSTNNTCWENAKYIELLNRSAICRDQDERKELLRTAEEILMDQMPIIPLFHYAMNFLQREGLSDMALSPIGQIDLRWARFDSEKCFNTLR